MTTYPNYSDYPDLYPNQSNLASASLLVRSGPAAGSRIDVPSTGLLFGRAASPAGQLGGDQALSSQHARVYFANGGLVIEDGPSRNGTYKNGQRISGPQLLQPGDVITLGATQVQVLAAPTTAPASLRPPAGTAVLPTARAQPGSLSASGSLGPFELSGVKPSFVAIVGRYLGRVIGVDLALAVLFGVLIVFLPGVRNRFGLILPIAVAAGLLALSGVALAVVAYLRSATTRLSLRAGQLDIDRGLWRRRLTTIDLRRLRRVTLDQTTLQRLTEHGTLVLYSVDRANPIRVTGLARGNQLRLIYDQLAALASASYR